MVLPTLTGQENVLCNSIREEELKLRLSYLFLIKLHCFLFNCRQSQPSKTPFLYHYLAFTNKNILQQTEPLQNQYRTNLLSCSFWERQQTGSLSLWAPCSESCLLQPQPYEIQVQVTQGGRLQVAQFSLNFTSWAAASQGVTNPAATCSCSFILPPLHPTHKIWQPGRNTVLALSHCLSVATGSTG